MSKEKCEVCGKVCGKKDFYKLCKRCQLPFIKGRKQGQSSIIGRVYALLAEIKQEGE